MKNNDNYIQKKYDVIIVGSGIAGITCGALLSEHSKNILILEQYSKVGGYFTTFSSKNYSFDAGIRAVEDSGFLRGVFHKLGILEKLNLQKSTTGLMFPKKLITLHDKNDIFSYFDYLGINFPDQIKGLKKIKKLVKNISGILNLLKIIPNPSDKHSILKVLFMPVFLLLNLKYLLLIGKVRKTLKKDLKEYLEENLNNKDLINILTQKFFLGTSAFFGLGYVQIFLDYYYPMGGMQKIPDILSKKIQSEGNIIKLNSKVIDLLYEKGAVCGVILEDGTKIYSKYVVYAGDGENLYKNMIPQELLPLEIKEKVSKARPSESNYSLFLGLDLPTKDLPFKDAGHVFYCPNLAGTSYSDRWDNKDFYRNTVLELSIPSYYDETMAPKGKSCLTISALALPEYRGNWGIVNGERTDKYHKLKEEIADQIIESLSLIIPNIREKIEVKITATPYTNIQYTMNMGGSITGWTQQPEFTFRKLNWKQMGKIYETPVKNLMHIGQWAYTPAGVPTCIIGAFVSAKKLLKLL